MERYICIHGHFYQPPRENPWLEEIEFQDSAYPYHDWNEKIASECYAPNAASRILDSDGKIIDIVNTYSKISFNFGPTLISWIEKHKPDLYEAILDADRLSIERFGGHGSAIAQAYNHMIMPLANRRDKYTQVIWGIRDFEKRFGRSPEGMWLPETAVDLETLEVLVNQGIKFTILAPRQAKRVRRVQGVRKWLDTKGEKIDPTMPYLCVLPSGRTINLFFYDGPIAQSVSFGGLLKNGEQFARRLISAFDDKRNHPQIVHFATDGETFGHHHRFGDMALSYALHHIESENLAKITNYGKYIEDHPPTHIVEIFDSSSWSCVHGVGRWSEDCGCSSGANPGWNQKWRKPLRDAMDSLRDSLGQIFSDNAARYLKNPWEARNEYLDIILDRSDESVGRFLDSHARKKISDDEITVLLKLLEIQRNAMLMYTSCGWFFDEISGIEPVQIMRYASRAIQYAEEITGDDLEEKFLLDLGKAKSNIFTDVSDFYETYVKSAKSDLLRAGAHYCISSIFEDYTEDTEIYCYTFRSINYEKKEAGKLTLVTGQAELSSNITRDRKKIYFAVLHLGDHNINAGVRCFRREKEYSTIRSEVNSAFEKGDIPGLIMLMGKHFNENIFTLWHLFRDEQRKVLDQILYSTYEGIESSYRHIYEDNFQIMSFYHSLQHRLPRPFYSATEYILNRDLKKVFGEPSPDLEELGKIIDEAKKWRIKVDSATAGYMVNSWIDLAMEKLQNQPDDIELLEKVSNTLKITEPLKLSLNLWKAQNIYFSISRSFYPKIAEKAADHDIESEKWLNAFSDLGQHLSIKI